MTDPQQPGTLWFMFWILFGLIAWPFVTCGKIVGCIPEESVVQPDCDLPTQRACNREKLRRDSYQEYEYLEEE